MSDELPTPLSRNDTPTSGTKSGVELVKQPHGGALRKGSNKGNTPGSGRPKDEVREKLAKLANGKGMRFLTKLMDGEVEVRFFGTCAKCQHRQELPENEQYMEKIINGIGDSVRASVDHRLKGNDQALRFGIGTKDEVDIRSHPETQRFVAQVAQLVRNKYGDEAFLEFAEDLKAIG